jgi:hypothetical protein
MDADSSVELGPTAPALELPWTDPEGRSHYVELRSELGSKEHGVTPIPSRTPDCTLDLIPEARRFPALRRFLVDANSQSSAWQSAKCDVWTDETKTTENLYNAGFTQNCYVDLVLADNAAALRGSLETHQQLANEMAQLLEADTSLEALAEIVVRRCYFHRNTSPVESDAGYCLTLFLIGYGSSPDEAAECWERTLDFAAGCLLKLRPCEDSAQKRELG